MDATAAEQAELAAPTVEEREEEMSKEAELPQKGDEGAGDDDEAARKKPRIESVDTKNANETMEKENKQSESAAASTAPDSSYAEHVSYEADGSAIYTDPATQQKYKWCTRQNAWQPCGDPGASDDDDDDDESSCDDKGASKTSTSKDSNPYENEHYRWCQETQQWLPKHSPGDQQRQNQSTETEHYRWDAERQEWVAKVPGEGAATTAAAGSDDGVVYGVDEDGQSIYTDKDGTVFQWDTERRAWFPKIDDDFMARYQMSYGFIDNTSASIAERQHAEEVEAQRKAAELQRLTEEAKAIAAAHATTATGGKTKAAPTPPQWFDMDPEHNTKVYVSNLPLDITIDEFAELMGKCGMIMRDAQTQKYKLKLYTEADGQLKGDGLCDYIKVESVALALKILDEYNLRGNKIHVQRAKFQMRGEYNPALKPKRKKKDKEKLQKMKEKLFDWRPEKMRGERSKNERSVIIKNLFHPDLFEKEVQLILDYQNDLREECTKCGTVRKVIIYDRHPEGIAQVNMTSPEEADMVIQMMQGRFFGQRQLSAEHWDGKTKYKTAETVNETEKRLNNWDQFLNMDEEKNSKDDEEQVKPAAAVEETASS